MAKFDVSSSNLNFFKKIYFLPKIDVFSSNLTLPKKMYFSPNLMFFVKFELFQKNIFFAKNRCFLAKFDVFWPNLMFFGHIFRKLGYISSFSGPEAHSATYCQRVHTSAFAPVVTVES